MRPEHPLEVVKPKIENRKYVEKPYKDIGQHNISDLTRKDLARHFTPEEIKLLNSDQQGAEFLVQYDQQLEEKLADPGINSEGIEASRRDLQGYLEYLKEGAAGVAAKASETPAGDAALESIPGFKDIAAAKTASKSINLDDVAAEIDRLRAEGKTDTKVSVGKPGDPIEGMEQAQAEKDAADASSAPSETERAADADSLGAVGSSPYAVALTKYKNDLLDLEKKYRGSQWKGILESFKDIDGPEALAKHKEETAAFLRSIGNKNSSKKETAQGSNASGGTTDSNEPTPPTPPKPPKPETVPEKGKGFGVKGMAIGAGLAGVAGYLARGNSGGNSDNDKQLLDMVRGMNPQQLRQILQQIQR